MRLVTISDIHIDVGENRAWLDRLCGQSHSDEIIIVAGDIASKLERIGDGLKQLAESYAGVFFVPGNHDLWVEPSSGSNSLQRFEELLSLCAECGVETQSTILKNENGDRAVAILPMFTWYAGPESGPGSLFLPKEGEDASLGMWVDRIRIRWPESMDCPVDYFLSLNQPAEAERDGIPAVSMSHFLPRQELIFSTAHERERYAGKGFDRAPRFNFSRVAGSYEIDRQLREWGVQTHIYGHQHRNRDRVIDGVRYLSHCLGYPQERAMVGVRAEDIEPLEVLTF